MRCYTFSINYLSSIQQGIQGAHAIAELFLKYPDSSDETGKYLYEWAKEHKTLICMNAGDFSQLSALHRFLVTYQPSYPWAAFNESSNALNGIMTSIAIIVPEYFYNSRAEEPFYIKGNDRQLIRRLNDYHLAH